jgi:hypothetical protein
MLEFAAYEENVHLFLQAGLLLSLINFGERKP